MPRPPNLAGTSELIWIERWKGVWLYVIGHAFICLLIQGYLTGARLRPARYPVQIMQVLHQQDKEAKESGQRQIGCENRLYSGGRA